MCHTMFKKYIYIRTIAAKTRFSACQATAFYQGIRFCMDTDSTHLGTRGCRGAWTGRACVFSHSGGSRPSSEACRHRQKQTQSWTAIPIEHGVQLDSGCSSPERRSIESERAVWVWWPGPPQTADLRWGERSGYFYICIYCCKIIQN